MSTRIDRFNDINFSKATKVIFNYARKLVTKIQQRSITDSGTFENELCSYNSTNIPYSILSNASFLLTPTAYKEDKLYSTLPTNGNGDLTWTRATDATRVNKDGYIERTPYNLNRYSQQLENTYWLKIASGTGVIPSVVQNAGLDPLGFLTADKVTLNRGAGNLSSDYSWLYGSVEVEAKIYTLSFYIKAFDVADIGKTLVARIAPANIFVTVTLTANWQRIVATSTTTATPTATAIDFYNRGVATTGGSTAVYLWGVQVVEGSVPKDYFPTTDRLNVPRLDYTGGVTCPCILVEPQRTNINLYSEDISNAYWTEYQLTVATNSIASPDGATTADKLVESVANDAHFIYSDVMSATQVVSVFLKYNGRPIIAVGNASQDHYALFNVQTGVVTSTGSNSISNGTIKDYGNGWYRCSCLFTYSGVNRLFGVVLTDNNNLMYTGDGVSGAYLWGVQREASSTLTSYIPTTSGTVTRNADVGTVTTPVGITSLIETYEDNTTNVVNPIPVTYQMSEGRIAKVVGL